MGNRFLISIVIPCYNQAQFLAEAVRSVIHQTYKDWEIIVVNDGSTDDTRIVAESLAREYHKSRISIINQSNQGLANSRNRGIQAAKGKYILPLDADDMLHPLMLQKTAGLLESRPEISIAYTDMQMFGAENRVANFGSFDLNRLLCHNIIPYCSLYRREVWKETGGYNPNMIWGYEDWDFWISCAERGYRGEKVSELLFLYRVKTSSMYTSALEHDLELKAQIVANHPALFDPETLKAAKSLLETKQSATDGHRNSAPSPIGTQEAVEDSSLPLVSVIVPTYNRPEQLAEALKSILAQTYKNLEIIVVNDCGQDVAHVVDSLNQRNNIRYIRHDINKGLAAARNTGIRAAEGKYIAYLDDDDIYYPNHVDALASFLIRSGHKVAYADAMKVHQVKKDGGYVTVEKELAFTSEFHRDTVLINNEHPVQSIMHEKSCIDNVGFFDETLTTLEDWELWIRMSRKYEFAHVHQVTSEVTWRTDGTTISSSRRPDFLPSQKAVYAKHRALAEGKPRVLRAQQISLQIMEREILALKESPAPDCRQTDGQKPGGGLSTNVQSRTGETVSIVIPTYNNLPLTMQCLEAIRRTAAPGTYEIVVVDNASSDGTRDFLLQEQSRGGLTALLNDSNRGFAKACNAGAQRSGGKYVLFLNNDTIPKPGWLDALVRTAESNPEIGVLGSKLLYPDGTVQHCGVVAGLRDGEPSPYHIYLCQPSDAPHVNKLREFQMVTGACLMVRRELFCKLGGFDEGFDNGHEDLDLCLRVRQAGKRVVYCPQSVLIHLEARTKRLIGLDNFHYKKGLENEEGRGRRRFLDKWREVLQIDEHRYFAEDGLVPRAQTPAPENRKEPGRDVGIRRILFMMYGWDDEGGGTILPRQIAKALTAQGYELSIIFTASRERPEKPPYFVEESNEDGIRLFGIYNRPAIFYDLDNPGREVNDPNMCNIVSKLIAHLRPDIVHYHSLLNFSMGVPEVVSRAGIPSVYTSHNYWPVCPRMYLFQQDLTLCPGPSSDGANCAACIGMPGKAADYALRAECGRRLFDQYIGRHLAVSSRVRQIFINNGHSPERIRVLQQQPETVHYIWREVGNRRVPENPPGHPLKVGFIGSLLPQKGIHVLVAAGQMLDPGQVEIHAFGSGPPPYISKLEELDRKNMVRFHGHYKLAQLPDILAGLDLVVIPSVWEDCAPLVVAEALAARVPVIGSHIGGIPDFILEGVNGLLFECGNPLALSGILRRLVEDPSMLQRMQRNITPGKGFEGYLAELVTHYKEVASSAASGPRSVAGAGSEKQLSVIWEGSQFVHHSLALINRELCSQLLAHGHDLSIIPYEANEFDPGSDERFRRLASRVHSRLSRPADVHVRHQWPPKFMPPPQGHWVMIQPWEFGRLPEDWIGPMSTLVDEIWVPSRHVLKTYVSSGIPVDRVRVIPNGVVTRLFHPGAAPYPLGTRKSFKFLFVGGTIQRKGIDVLLEAYRSSFSSRDDVSLVIKDMGQNSFYKSMGAGAMIRRIQEDPNAPEILYLTDMLNEHQMPGLFTACDCLVHPYRGEGFGLPVLESMACGVPVMVTSGGATDDFCSSDSSFLIPSRRRETSVSGVRLVGGMGWMLEPDLEELKKLLRHVFENRGEAAEKADRALRHAVADYTWEKVAGQVMTRMREISKRPIRRFAG